MAGFSNFPLEQEITSGKFKVMRIQVECSLPSVRKWSKFAAFMHAKECPRRKVLSCRMPSKVLWEKTLLKVSQALVWSGPWDEQGLLLHHSTHQEETVVVSVRQPWLHVPGRWGLLMETPKYPGYQQKKPGAGHMNYASLPAIQKIRDSINVKFKSSARHRVRAPRTSCILQ